MSGRVDLAERCDPISWFPSSLLRNLRLITGVSAAGGVRPDVYVGLAVAACMLFCLFRGLSRPFTGVLLVGRTGGP